jgi:hypothetical protein
MALPKKINFLKNCFNQFIYDREKIIDGLIILKRVKRQNLSILIFFVWTAQEEFN